MITIAVRIHVQVMIVVNVSAVLMNASAICLPIVMVVCGQAETVRYHHLEASSPVADMEIVILTVKDLSISVPAIPAF